MAYQIIDSATACLTNAALLRTSCFCNFWGARCLLEYLLERDVALVLYEGCMPWDTCSRLGQLRVEVAVGWTVESHSLHLAIWLAFVGIDEPGGPKRSVTASTLAHPISLTDIPWHRKRRQPEPTSTRKRPCRHPNSASSGLEGRAHSARCPCR